MTSHLHPVTALQILICSYFVGLWEVEGDAVGAEGGVEWGGEQSDDLECEVFRPHVSSLGSINIHLT